MTDGGEIEESQNTERKADWTRLKKRVSERWWVAPRCNRR